MGTILSCGNLAVKNYFEMAGIDRSNWVRIASMYFEGPAARWLQSVQHRVNSVGWDVFSKLVHDRFGRDHHEILIRQLFHIKQNGSVADYVENFSQLVDQLAAYTATTDPLYYTLRFIDGLRDDIKPIVLVQRPQDLDTAFVLATLQEEVADPYKKREYKKQDQGYSHKNTLKNALPLPAPPLRDKHVSASGSDDKRGIEGARAFPSSSSVDSKAAALKAYRRAMGLCFKCNEKWSRDHTCAPTVQLHAVQELWELFQLDDEEVATASQPGFPSEQLFMAISKAAITGVDAPRTVKFMGSIQHRPITTLVDSGSSNSFISSLLASRLAGISSLPNRVSVQVEGGGTLSCSAVLLKLCGLLVSWLSNLISRCCLLSLMMLSLEWIGSNPSAPCAFTGSTSGWKFHMRIGLSPCRA
jgi:hypothetical protein